jgi:hypothetical protein
MVNKMIGIMAKFKNKQNKLSCPCDSCQNYNRYSIRKTTNGEIIRYSCADTCLRIKRWSKQVVKDIYDENV